MPCKRTHSRFERILVAGLGNLLLADDGVGVHAARALLGSRPRGVRVVEVGTAVLDALHLFERADRVLALDAIQGGGQPGEIYALRLGDAANPTGKVSLHDFGLRTIFDFLATPRRPEVLVLGVEPQRIDYGLTLSPAVENVLPRLLAEAHAILRRWQGVCDLSVCLSSPSPSNFATGR